MQFLSTDLITCWRCSWSMCRWQSIQVYINRPAYLLEQFLVNVQVEVHAVSVSRPDYLLEVFLVHVQVAVHTGFYLQTCLPTGAVPGSCAGGSPYRFLSTDLLTYWSSSMVHVQMAVHTGFYLQTCLPTGAVPGPCVGGSPNRFLSTDLLTYWRSSWSMCRWQSIQVSIYRPAYLLERFLVHVQVAVQTGFYLQTCLPTEAVPGPCAGGSPYRFLSTDLLSYWSSSWSMCKWQSIQVSIYRPAYQLEQFLVHVQVAVHTGFYLQTCLPTEAVPGPCAGGSPYRFLSTACFPTGAFSGPCASGSPYRFLSTDLLTYWSSSWSMCR
jgi:hypothetical protein